MTIIDSQVHAYEANTPKRPWHSVPNWPDYVTGDEMVAAMDKVGVDGAIFISAFSMYRYDASYAVEVQRAHPGRFAIVKPVDPDDPAVGDIIADWKQTPGAVGTAPEDVKQNARTGLRSRPLRTGTLSIATLTAPSKPLQMPDNCRDMTLEKSGTLFALVGPPFRQGSVAQPFRIYFSGNKYSIGG